MTEVMLTIFYSILCVLAGFTLLALVGGWLVFICMQIATWAVLKTKKRFEEQEKEEKNE